MSHTATHPDRVAPPDHRAQVLAEAVVSAYIDEIARPGRRPHRATAARSTRRRRPLALDDGSITTAPRGMARRAVAPYR